jgi:hypothetical protein
MREMREKEGRKGGALSSLELIRRRRFKYNGKMLNSPFIFVKIL